MEPEEHILNAVRWRQYEILGQLVEKELSEWGWRSIKKLFLVRETKVPHPRVRDAVLYILGLDSVRGIDIPYENLLRKKGVGGTSLTEVRASVTSMAHDMLQDMIEKKNTYLLNVDAIAAGPFAVLVPDILDVRKKEILALPSECTVGEMMETAYGYSVLTTCGSLTSNRQRGFQRMRDAMNKIADEMGRSLTIKSSPLQLGPRISGFENCTSRMRDLLWHILRLLAYRGKQAVRKSAKFIRDHADSRFLPWLHHYLSDADLYYTAVKIMKALSNIGHPSSADFLLPFTRRRGNWGRSSLNALANLAGDQIGELIIQTVKSGYRSTYRICHYLESRPPEEVLRLLKQLDNVSDSYSRRRLARLRKQKQAQLTELGDILASA